MTKNMTHETTLEQEQAENEIFQDEQPVQKRSTALALIPMGHAPVSPIHGVSIDVDADFEAKVQAVSTIDQMIGGDSQRIDKYLNTVVWAIGVVQHDATVRNDADQLNEATRTVLHVIATKGQVHDAESFSFTSSAVANYFATRIIPLFGIRFERPLGFRFSKVPTRKGSTYSIQLVSDIAYPNWQ